VDQAALPGGLGITEQSLMGHAGCNGFYGGACFMGCVWMGENVSLYLMGWGGLGIRQMRVGVS
jgi:hypothetical protein